MKNKDRKLLSRFLEGELSSREESRLRRLLAESPEASEELRKLKAVQHLVSSSTTPTFSPGFADRVMARVASERLAKATNGRTLADSLAPAFYRVAVAGTAAVIALGALGLVQGADDTGQSAVEIMLGLPAYTFESAYEVEDELLALLETGDPEVRP